MVERDPEYDWIPPYSQPKRMVKKGLQCGECGMKFDYGTSYAYSCGNPQCPRGISPSGRILP
jgi:hypothetical protein